MNDLMWLSYTVFLQCLQSVNSNLKLQLVQWHTNNCFSLFKVTDVSLLCCLMYAVLFCFCFVTCYDVLMPPWRLIVSPLFSSLTHSASLADSMLEFFCCRSLDMMFILLIGFVRCIFCPDLQPLEFNPDIWTFKMCVFVHWVYITEIISLLHAFDACSEIVLQQSPHISVVYTELRARLTSQIAKLLATECPMFIASAR